MQTITQRTLDVQLNPSTSPFPFVVLSGPVWGPWHPEEMMVMDSCLYCLVIWAGCAIGWHRFLTICCRFCFLQGRVALFQMGEEMCMQQLWRILLAAWRHFLLAHIIDSRNSSESHNNSQCTTTCHLQMVMNLPECQHVGRHRLC